MENTNTNIAQRLAEAASEFQTQSTGRAPDSVAVVLSGQTLVVTLHGALSPAEKVLSQSADGAASVQEFHRQLFADSCEPLRQEIQRITGAEVREAGTEIEPITGAVIQSFTNGTVVQVFLLANHVADSAWHGQDIASKS